MNFLYHLGFIMKCSQITEAWLKQRLKDLKKRFSRDKQYHEDYTRFMEDIVQKGYAEKSFQQVRQGKTKQAG